MVDAPTVTGRPIFFASAFFRDICNTFLLRAGEKRITKVGRRQTGALAAFGTEDDGDADDEPDYDAEQFAAWDD